MRQCSMPQEKSVCKPQVYGVRSPTSLFDKTPNETLNMFVGRTHTNVADPCMFISLRMLVNTICKCQNLGFNTVLKLIAPTSAKRRNHRKSIRQTTSIFWQLSCAMLFVQICDIQLATFWATRFHRNTPLIEAANKIRRFKPAFGLTQSEYKNRDANSSQPGAQKDINPKRAKPMIAALQGPRNRFHV